MGHKVARHIMGSSMTDLRYEPDGEVLKGFLMSESRLCAIQGPWGSGKSTACGYKLLMNALRQPPGPDGVRRRRTYVGRNCYSADTEILTEGGWVGFPDLRPGERVAMLDGGELVYVEPSFYYSAPYKGEMIG